MHAEFGQGRGGQDGGGEADEVGGEEVEDLLALGGGRKRRRGETSKRVATAPIAAGMEVELELAQV